MRRPEDVGVTGIPEEETSPQKTAFERMRSVFEGIEPEKDDQFGHTRSIRFPDSDREIRVTREFAFASDTGRGIYNPWKKKPAPDVTHYSLSTGQFLAKIQPEGLTYMPIPGIDLQVGGISLGIGYLRWEKDMNGISENALSQRDTNKMQKAAEKLVDWLEGVQTSGEYVDPPIEGVPVLSRPVSHASSH